MLLILPLAMSASAAEPQFTMAYKIQVPISPEPKDGDCFIFHEKTLTWDELKKNPDASAYSLTPCAADKPNADPRMYWSDQPRLFQNVDGESCQEFRYYDSHKRIGSVLRCGNNDWSARLEKGFGEEYDDLDAAKMGVEEAYRKADDPALPPFFIIPNSPTTPNSVKPKTKRLTPIQFKAVN